MKSKKIISLLACALSALSLTACTGDTAAELKNYWEKDVLAPQPILTETLTYAVSFKAESGMNQIGYAFDYANGLYTTVLNKKTDGTYEYTTSLTIDITYTLDGQTPVTKQDTVTSYVHFQDANNDLRPISSNKTIHCHTPLSTSQPETIEDCYLEVYYELSTAYENGKGTSTTVNKLNADKTETKSFSLGEKLTYLDNEQLFLALRAISEDTNSVKFNTYAPFEKALQKTSVSFAKKDEESVKFNISENGAEASEKTYQYRQATMQLAQDPPGAAKTVWLALNQTRNRNVILRIETPLSYAFGSLVYELKSITRADN